MIRFVQLTPPGRGAIATLLVEGPGAWAMVESQFRPARGRPWPSPPPEVPLAACPAAPTTPVGADLSPPCTGRLVFGHFDLFSGDQVQPAGDAAGLPGEEVVVRRRDDGSVELHCHGGMAAVAAIGRALAQRGCQAVSWQQWVHGQQSDAIAAAARLALAQARTERTALVLLDQYQGALRAALETVRRSLAGGDLPSARQQLETLLAREDLGRHMTDPWRVVMAGLPNVGKSSLINTLVGYQRAIVHPAPGTTRDVVAATTALEGWPVELRDTAGLRSGGHPVEQAGIARARDELQSGDLVLLIFDAGQPWSTAAEALCRSRPDALVVHNKCDLPAAAGVAAGATPGRPLGVSTSALTGEGIDRLIGAVVARLVPHLPLAGDAVPFTVEQCDRLRLALASLDRDDAKAADEALKI